MQDNQIEIELESNYYTDLRTEFCAKKIEWRARAGTPFLSRD
jgi:hypothetical protein